MNRWRGAARRFVVLGVLGAAAVVVIAGCGGGAHSKVALSITVTRHEFKRGAKPTTITQHFSLNCKPTGGTLPLRAQVCAEIIAHQQAMLAPRKERSACSGSPFMPTVDVSVKRGAAGGGLSGSPYCAWPGGAPLAIYYAASTKDARALRRAEPLVRCDEDRSLAVSPTPWASVAACIHGLWTPAAEWAIRRAETATALANLAPTTLFPGDPGARRCRIPAGGPQMRTFPGLCEVKLTGPPSAKLVHFAETWYLDGRHWTHRWTIRGRTLVSTSGAPPPQLLA